MSENYTVAVKLSLINDVSKGLVMMGGQFAMLQKQADVFQAKMVALKSNLAMGGMLLAGGAAIASPFIVAIKMAGNLQQELVGVQFATHASNKEMEAFRKTVEQTGTIFNAVEVAKMAKTIAQSGNFKIGQVASITPEIAKFATVQQLLKGTDYQKSTSMAIKLAEVTGHFDPESIKKTLDSFNKLSLMMPGSIDKVLQAFVYAQGTMKNVMGVSDESSLLLVAVLQRMGIEGTRAGSQLLAMISRTIPGVMGSGLWKGESAKSLRTMGLLDKEGKANVFTEGKFDPSKFFGKIGTFVDNEFKTKTAAQARNDIMYLFQSTWGTQGTRIASLFLTKQGREQLTLAKDQYNKAPNMQETYAAYMGTLNAQLLRLKANLSTFFTELGMSLLPIATNALKYFNDQIQRFTEYVRTHQSQVAFFEKLILSFAGLMAVSGTLILLKAGITGLFIPFQMLSGLILGIGAISAPALLAVGALAAVSFAIYQLFLKNQDFSLDNLLFQFHELEITLKNSQGFLFLQNAATAINTAFHDLGDYLTYLSKKINDFIAFLPASKDAEGKTTAFGKVKEGLMTGFASMNPFLSLQKALTPATAENKGLGVLSPLNLAKEALKPVNPEKAKEEHVMNQLVYKGATPLFNAYKGLRMPGEGEAVDVTSPNKNNNVTPSLDKNIRKKPMGGEAPSDGSEKTTPSLINIQNDIHIDGQKIATSFAQKIYNQATNAPNSNSMFDSSLSPMPTNVNAIGLGY